MTLPVRAMEYIGFIEGCPNQPMGSRVGALARLNSHFDVGMPVSFPCRPVPNVFRNCECSTITLREEEHGYRFTTAFTFSVRTPK